ncbi:MAG TPA: hypothetical protein VMD53_07320 [Rhizomicrobium sp.]|nr:hypothetical protein [Rhizomicrobium sp.]
MAFDIHLACLNNGETNTFKRALAQEILGRDSLDEEGALYYVVYKDGGSSCVYCSENEDLQSMMFNHSGGDVFFERLWELADRTGSMIFWPGYDVTTAVTRPEMLEHVPHHPETDPWAFVVRSGRELVKAMSQTS